MNPLYKASLVTVGAIALLSILRALDINTEAFVFQLMILSFMLFATVFIVIIAFYLFSENLSLTFKKTWRTRRGKK